MHMVASSNGKDNRFSVYRSEFDSLCDYHVVEEELLRTVSSSTLCAHRSLIPSVWVTGTKTHFMDD